MPNKFYILSILILLLAGGAITAATSRPVPIVVKTNLENLPMVISGYSAVEDSFSEAVYKELNADKHIYRHYRSGSGDQIDLYIGYYGTAKGGRTGHNPYACLPGGGAAIIDTGMVYLKQAATGRRVPINYVLARKDGTDTILLHWYQTAGNKVVSSGVMQNIERFSGRILKNRNDGAFVQVTASPADGDVHRTKERVEQFAENVLGHLPNFWPEEK